MWVTKSRGGKAECNVVDFEGKAQSLNCVALWLQVDTAAGKLTRYQELRKYLLQKAGPGIYMRSWHARRLRPR